MLTRPLSELPPFAEHAGSAEDRARRAAAQRVDMIRAVESNAILAAARAEAARLAAALEDVRARHDALEAEAVGLRDAVQKIHASTTWRMTRPLVALVEQVRGWRRGRPAADADATAASLALSVEAEAIAPADPVPAAPEPEPEPPPDAPRKFVPRDGGFFSNLNFLVGDIVQGRIVYPMFCLEEIRRRHGAVRQFAYAGEADENSWFEFFEPIRFHDGDDMHRDAAVVRALPPLPTESAPPEFRVPAASMRLYHDPGFPAWRQTVHAATVGKIRPTARITREVERMIASMPGRRIGVHLRHPSHMVEQGHVFFEDYFAIVDRLRAGHARASVFLATDNDLALSIFRDRYGDALFHHAGFIRESIDDVLAWSYSLAKGVSDDMGFVSGIGFQSHYRLASAGGGAEGVRAGREAVIDAYTLARCDDFVCTASNVTLTCSFLNPELRLHQVSRGSG